MSDDLRQVGRDCPCGHPLVWRNGYVWCPVYGSHPNPLHVRNLDAPAAALVDLVAGTPAFTPPADLTAGRAYQRHARAQARLRAQRRAS